MIPRARRARETMIAFLKEHVWSHLPATVTRKQCVREAFIWGGVFAAIGFAWLYWLGHPIAGKVFIGLGAFLAVTLPIPGLGERVYLTVLRGAAIMGFIIARVALTAVFYVVVTPMGLLLRLSGKDPLDLKFKQSAPPAWREHSGKTEPRQYYRLF